MSEIGPFSGEQQIHPDLDIIVSRQAEWLGTTLAPNETEALRFYQGIQLTAVIDKDLYCRYPAKIVENRAGDMYTLHYDIPTMQNLTDSFAQTYQFTEAELSELYIGTAMAGHLLHSRVSDQNQVRLTRMINVLTNIDPVLNAVRTTNIIPDDLKEDALLNLMKSNSVRSGNINVLRFAFGMIYMQPDEPSQIETVRGEYISRESRIMRQFRSGLLSRLNDKDRYIEFGSMFNRDEMFSERVFMDDTGEFEFAACFPMHWQEIRTLLDICS